MAGPSAADVRSVFSLPPSAPGPSQPKTSATAERARKPEGMSRELYSLIGPSTPTLVAQLAKPRLKQKPNLGGGGRVKWCVLFPLCVNVGDPRPQRTKALYREWRSFRNQGRTDNLTLSHWVKASTPPDAGNTHL